MNSTYGKLAIVAVVLVAAGLIAFSGPQSDSQTETIPPPPQSDIQSDAVEENPQPDAPEADVPVEDQPVISSASESQDSQASSLPRLVDLGANSCIPCKMMEPVLEKLGEDYQGRLDVEVINIAENRAAAEKYGVRVIPTQVFFDASGTELARHEGFMGRDDILKTFEENGVEIPPKDDAG